MPDVAVAVTVTVPGVAPAVAVIDATPSAVTALGWLRVTVAFPVEPVTAKSTVLPLTGALPSVSITDSGSENAVPAAVLWLLPDVIVMPVMTVFTARV